MTNQLTSDPQPPAVSGLTRWRIGDEYEGLQILVSGDERLALTLEDAVIKAAEVDDAVARLTADGKWFSKDQLDNMDSNIMSMHNEITDLQAEVTRLREERDTLMDEIGATADSTREMIQKLELEVASLRASLAATKITGSTSDGYHTFDELYAYRKAFNALLFECWAALGQCDVHKAWKHSDGEPCFGGGWFIVVAQTPFGQISNHYKAENWDLFNIPERDRSAEYDGHTPQVALERMLRLAATEEKK